MTEHEYRERINQLAFLIQDQNTLKQIYSYARWKYVSSYINYTERDPPEHSLIEQKYTAWESIKRFFRFPFWQD